MANVLDKIKCYILKLWEFLKAHKGRTITVLAMLLVMLLLRIFKNNAYFAEYVYARGISRGYLFAVSSVTSLLPFSLSDFAYAFLVIYSLTALVLLIVTLCKRQFNRFGKWLYNICLCWLVVVLGFNLTFTGLYSREPLSAHLDLSSPEMTLDLVDEAARFYVSETACEVDGLEYDEKGSVVCPYTFSELSDLVAAEMNKLTVDPFFNDFNLRAKPMLFSRIMSYAGFSGVNFPLLAEANINTDAPAYQVPTTIAHEFAHLMGVIPENEANLLAVYALIQSDNAYLRYSALMSAQNSILGELYYMTDTPERYNSVTKNVPEEVWREYTYASAVWDQYENPLDKITNYLNDRYLKNSGLPSGVKSYSDTGRFYTALYLKLKDAA